MEVRIHGKHMDVSDGLKTLAEDKVVHAARVFDDAVSLADVEFTQEQNPRISEERYRVEITATAVGQTVRVDGTRGVVRILSPRADAGTDPTGTPRRADQTHAHRAR